MAIAVEEGYGYLTITLDGTNSFAWDTATVTTGNNSGSALATLYPNGLKLTGITVYPGAVGSKTVVRDRSATGTVIPPFWYSVDGGPQGWPYLGRFYKPYITHTDQTSDSGTKVSFFFEN